MCEYCDQETGEPMHCEECGRLMCFDWKQCDDVACQAVVTSSGDVMCLRCARRFEEEQRRIDEEEAAFYWDDPQDEAYEI